MMLDIENEHREFEAVNAELFADHSFDRFDGKYAEDYQDQYVQLGWTVWLAAKCATDKDTERYSFLFSPDADYRNAKTSEQQKAVRDMWSTLNYFINDDSRVSKNDVDTDIDAAMQSQPSNTGEEK